MIGDTVVVGCGNCELWQIDAPVWLTMAPPEYAMFVDVCGAHAEACPGTRGFRTVEVPSW